MQSRRNVQKYFELKGLAKYWIVKKEAEFEKFDIVFECKLN